MVDYKDSLNLPKTAFEMRASLAQKEPQTLALWEKQDLYGRIQAAREGQPKFVMHDGPPYANGHLHHGHILNKILKDIVVKDKTMRNLKTGFIPGWDCHGLPIEVQVDKELGKRKAEMSKAEIRAACRDYAQKFVAIQRDEFKRLGVLADWDKPYLTMNFGYEATIVKELSKFASNNLLYKGLRPVNWCTVHQTALAEAEVEYDDHTSPSIYVAFPLTKKPAGFLDQELDVVIWTTTPWTLPANLAVCLHPTFNYIVYPVKGRLRIVGQPLLAAFLAALGEPPVDETKIKARFKGSELEGLQYRLPLFDRLCPIILGEHVTDETGTGCVHTAPGHGPDDFFVGQRYGLSILSPVDGRGVFLPEAAPFAGQAVFEANPAIIAALQDSGALLSDPKNTVSHRYAHCWRCHKPIILRATEQWFVAIDKPFADGPSLRQRALAALKDVSWIPPWGQDRIGGMLAVRPDWCLSRQRTWGVPIPVVYCEKCQTPVIDCKIMNAVATIFEREGADAWFVRPVEDFVGDLRCQKCGHQKFTKEDNILDVWFDSGVSFAAVILQANLGQTVGPPVDLYLEGSDQHRGWFHSALLVGLATRQTAPFKTVLTHGFVVDGQGKKVSKSKGNFIDPFLAIKENGAELLRLWVASEDYREDIRISNEILTRLTDSYRKVRNTIRYLLGSLPDFDPNSDLVLPSELIPLDAYALALVKRTTGQMLKAYEHYEFHVVLHRLVELCIVDLSAFYFDIIKDRLYASKADSPLRRSAQTALYIMARDLLRAMAPIISFTAEEAWACLPRLKTDPDSVHLAIHPEIAEPDKISAINALVESQAAHLTTRYLRTREIRALVNTALETARRNKELGSSVEAGVDIIAPPEDFASLSVLGPTELADVFIVSEVTLSPGSELSIKVRHAPGTKCARCWLYRQDIGQNTQHPTVCGRCAEALK